MIISEREGIYSAQHVTGPTHNLLRLKLERGAKDDLTILVLPPMGHSRQREPLKSEDVLPFIRAGIADANTILGTNFVAVHAEIVEDDSRQPAVYEYIARKIVEEAAKRQIS